MKLVRSANGKLVFHLGQRDKLLLLQVLKLYPRITSVSQPLTKSGKLPGHEANQRLLEEALAEQRSENKKHLETLLTDPRRFADSESGCILTLSRADMEWLLQVLNDIRIGSWVLLGSPEEKFAKLTLATAPHYWAMEMSGIFQSRFLEALEG
jgi:hypothetical protein